MLSNIRTKDLKLAKIKRWDVVNNGVEVNQIDAYTFLYFMNGNYINLFDFTNNYPVFKRVPYSNTTKDGESYGTKVEQVAGDISKSGPCYMLSSETAFDLFGVETISLDMLKKYIVNSDLFFPDRKTIIDNDYSSFKKIKNLPKIIDDQIKKKQLDAYLYSSDDKSRKNR